MIVVLFISPSTTYPGPEYSLTQHHNSNNHRLLDLIQNIHDPQHTLFHQTNMKLSLLLTCIALTTVAATVVVDDNKESTGASSYLRKVSHSFYIHCSCLAMLVPTSFLILASIRFFQTQKDTNEISEEDSLLKDVPDIISSKESDIITRDLFVFDGHPDPVDPMRLTAVMNGRKNRMSAIVNIHFHTSANSIRHTSDNSIHTTSEHSMQIDYSIVNGPKDCTTCFLAIHESSYCNNLGKRFYDRERLGEDPWPKVKIETDSERSMKKSITIDGNGYTINQNTNRAVAIYKTVVTEKGRKKNKLIFCSDNLGRLMH